MKYLLSIQRPNDFKHAEQLDATVHAAIDQVNDEMVAAGIRLFVGGLQSPTTATSIHLGSDGELSTTTGRFLQATHYVDGFWVLECANQDEAIEWGRKAALACRGPIEVRPFAGAVVG